MKTRHKTMIVLFTAGIISLIVCTGCKTSGEKVEDARDNLQNSKVQVIEARQELNQALNDSILQFKRESGAILTANEQLIADLKSKMAAGEKKTNARYEKLATELEKTNSDLKAKLNAFNDSEQEKWQAFKREFGHDMDELGNSIEDLTSDNVN